MRIVVSRSGGVTGMTRTWRLDVVEESEVLEWRRLIDACPWDADLDGDGRPDRFSYLIVVDRRAATVPERALNGPWRELVERVQAAR